MAWKDRLRSPFRGIRPALALGGRYRSEIARYVRPDRTIIRQSGVVLAVCAAIALFPGIFLGALERYLVLIPGLLILIPPTVGLRGNIFGALSSRLSSKLHLGTIEPEIRGNRVLLQQLLASTIQLLVLSIAIPLVGGAMGFVLGIRIAPLYLLVFISLSAGLFSGIAMFTISVGITFLSYGKGWDPDNVSTPIIATAGDLLTVPILFFCAWLSLSVEDIMGRFPLLIISGVILVSTLVLTASLMSRSDMEGKRILRDSLPVAGIALLLSTASGVMLGAAFEAFIVGSVFLAYIPVFNEQGGSMGSILGSRLTSAAYLGSVKMTARPGPFASSSSVSLWLVSIAVFVMLSFLSIGLGPVMDLSVPPIWAMVLALVLGATLITLVSSAIAYYVALISFRIGLDPDNVVIPLLTALMDIVGSGSLILCILVAGTLF